MLQTLHMHLYTFCFLISNVQLYSSLSVSYPVKLTHWIDVVEDLVHPDNLVIQLIIAGRVRQERVPVGHKQVKHIHNLEGH